MQQKHQNIPSVKHENLNKINILNIFLYQLKKAVCFFYYKLCLKCHSHFLQSLVVNNTCIKPQNTPLNNRYSAKWPCHKVDSAADFEC